MKQREPWKVVVFGLITLGFYDIYWLYETRKELKALGQQIPPVLILMLPLIVLTLLLAVHLVVFGILGQGTSEFYPGNKVLGILIIIGTITSLLATIPVWLYWFYKYSQAVAAVTDNRMSFGMAYGLSILFSAYGISSVWAGMIQHEFNKVSTTTKTVDLPANKPVDTN